MEVSKFNLPNIATNHIMNVNLQTKVFITLLTTLYVQQILRALHFLAQIKFS